MSRPKGSKNKTRVIVTDVAQLAKHFATVFICSYHLDGAEKLAQKILEQIRAQRKER